MPTRLRPGAIIGGSGLGGGGGTGFGGGPGSGGGAGGRRFTSAFLAQAKRKNGAMPYMVLEIDYTDQTRYYLDRPKSSIVNHQSALPTIEAQLVLDWPAVSLSLKEGQVGTVDQTQVVLDDAAGYITGLLSGTDQQRQIVKVWRMFDDPTCTWGTDNALIFAGCLRPFNWAGKDNTITLSVGDLGPLLAKSMSFPAAQAIFTKVPPSYQDRQIPLCWGQAQRVEAICVQRPWETTILQGTTATGFTPISPETAGPNLLQSMTVNIADDPSDIGVDGTGHTSYSAMLGTQPVTVTFNQSATPGNGTSTATITATISNQMAQFSILQMVNGAGEPQIVINTNFGAFRTNFSYLSVFNLENIFTVGWPVFVSIHGGTWYQTTLIQLLPHQPFQDNLGIEWYVVSLSDPTGYIQANAVINDNIIFMNQQPAIQSWPPGTVLRQTGVNSIYIANALPSKNIIKIEGYGTITDSNGANRKDFIPLGQTASVVVSGSTTSTVVSNALTINRNDNTWNNPPGTLFGQNVTTITFPGTPRDLFAPPVDPTTGWQHFSSLDDNRIWVSLDGVEDVGDGSGNLISNPALIILQYLENTHLMNVSGASINATSFATAAMALAGYFSGFAQVEAVDGLSLLQHIASLCHSVLFFDQGEANIVVLSDSPGDILWVGDTSTNDNMLQGSLTHSESAVDDVINDLTFKWRGFWDDKTGQILQDSKNVKLTSVAAFGRVAKEINPCNIYWRRADVAAERDWWLQHLSSIFRYVTFTAFLDALILQPGDWVQVTWIDGGGRNLFGGAKSMQVTKCTDTGRDGLVTIEARYVAFSYS